MSCPFFYGRNRRPQACACGFDQIFQPTAYPAITVASLFVMHLIDFCACEGRPHRADIRLTIFHKREALLGQFGPGCSCNLVRHSNGDPCWRIAAPEFLSATLSAPPCDTGRGVLRASAARRKVWPHPEIESNRISPPVPLCRGTRPRDAANSRPDLKVLASPIVATKAVAVSLTIPDTSETSCLFLPVTNALPELIDIILKRVDAS
jgi:hypothetical protein